MKKGFLFLILLSFIFSCGKKARSDEAPRDPSPLESSRRGIELWAEKCQGGVSKKDCGDGDSTLWNGLLCASGEDFACQAVVSSQDESGRVWRSPRLKGIDPQNTFSRDMGLGTLSFLVKTHDKEFGNKWASYINANKALCERENDRCAVTPSFLWIFNSVANDVGFTKLSPSTITGFTGDAVDDAWLLAQSFSSPSGYQLHLVGVTLYIRILMGDWNAILEQAAKKLSEREPQNIFFEFLAKGKSQALADKLVKRLPLGPNEKRHQWCWERTDSENACQDSMGWDFIFAINLMTK